MLVAAGFTRKDKHMVDYVVSRMNNDLRDLSIRSYLSSVRRVKPVAVHTAAKQMNLGEYKIMRDLFKRSRRVQKKELEA